MEDLKRNKTTAAQAIGIEDSKDHLFRPGEKTYSEVFRAAEAATSPACLFQETRVPRRLSPIPDGEEVGYAVRFDRKAHPMKAKLGYMTDGMLTEVAKTDSISNLYAYIITDEAHERTLSTDPAGLTQGDQLLNVQI
ncbi:Pre-mRNA-splicing factor ATP-dependent RNA helicase-like protein PRP2 [Fusarium oxysporum f. sp. conglutinans]|nr:Pre-mRNA-splicing factor ATP-dependent RNA helicase-like protein PRP2 [Fusarium oxysporum f. sp. conglutinans]